MSKSDEIKKLKKYISKLEKAYKELANKYMFLLQKNNKVYTIKNGVMIESHPADGM